MYPSTIHKKESTTQASDVPQLPLPEHFCIPPTAPHQVTTILNFAFILPFLCWMFSPEFLCISKQNFILLHMPWDIL